MESQKKIGLSFGLSYKSLLKQIINFLFDMFLKKLSYIP